MSERPKWMPFSDEEIKAATDWEENFVICGSETTERIISWKNHGFSRWDFWGEEGGMDSAARRNGDYVPFEEAAAAILRAQIAVLEEAASLTCENCKSERPLLAPRKSLDEETHFFHHSMSVRNSSHYGPHACPAHAIHCILRNLKKELV